METRRIDQLTDLEVAEVGKMIGVKDSEKLHVSHVKYRAFECSHGSGRSPGLDAVKVYKYLLSIGVDPGI